MLPSVLPAFSTACPRCQSAAIRPARQRNDFAPAWAGGRHVTTTRDYSCGGCGHAWSETVPHRPDPGDARP